MPEFALALLFTVTKRRNPNSNDPTGTHWTTNTTSSGHAAIKNRKKWCWKIPETGKKQTYTVYPKGDVLLKEAVRAGHTVAAVP